MDIDSTDRAIINALQGGFPISDEPFAEVAAPLGLDDQTLISRIGSLLDEGVLSRFGPMYDAEAMGGAFTLCAMSVPGHRFERVAEIVNGYAEVAHNYERDHHLNMWFVIGAPQRDIINRIIANIESRTGLPVMDMPKEKEFFIGLKLKA